MRTKKLNQISVMQQNKHGCSQRFSFKSSWPRQYIKYASELKSLWLQRHKGLASSNRRKKGWMLQDESTLTFNNRINQKRSAPPELFNDEQLLCFALSSDALNHQILNQNDPLRRRIRVLHLYVFIRINLKKKKKKNVYFHTHHVSWSC